MKDASGAPVKWHTGAVLDLAMGRLGVGFVAIAVCMNLHWHEWLFHDFQPSAFWHGKGKNASFGIWKNSSKA